MKAYRDQGAIGALLDEYEKAMDELFDVIRSIHPDELTCIIDTETKDEDCRSIQTILTHVIRAGYFYTQAIRKNKGDKVEANESIVCDNIDDYIIALKEMFTYNVALFEAYPNLTLDSQEKSDLVFFQSGQVFDYEQLMEHAIVHILRHRRQIERFRIKYKSLN